MVLARESAKDEFVRHVEKLVAGAMRQVKQAHGEILIGSVARRVAAQLWAQGARQAHATDADWVRHVRGMTGLTQAEFARQLGTTQVSVARWERGVTKPASYYRKAIEQFARDHAQPVA